MDTFNYSVFSKYDEVILQSSRDLDEPRNVRLPETKLHKTATLWEKNHPGLV